MRHPSSLQQSLPLAEYTRLCLSRLHRSSHCPSPPACSPTAKTQGHPSSNLGCSQPCMGPLLQPLFPPSPTPRLKGHHGRKSRKNVQLEGIWSLVFWTWHYHCYYEPTAAMVACIRPVQGQTRQTSSMDGKELMSHPLPPCMKGY